MCSVKNSGPSVRTYLNAIEIAPESLPHALHQATGTNGLELTWSIAADEACDVYTTDALGQSYSLLNAVESSRLPLPTDALSGFYRINRRKK